MRIRTWLVCRVSWIVKLWAIWLKMYHSGSQKNHWTFESEKELIELRMKANQKFIGQNGTDMDVSCRKKLMFCLHSNIWYKNVSSIFRINKSKHSSWILTRRACCLSSMSCTCVTSVSDLSHRCQKRRSALHSITLRDFIWTIRRWIIIPRRYCEFVKLCKEEIDADSSIAFLEPPAPISPARSKSSTCRFSNSAATSKAIATKRWT